MKKLFSSFKIALSMYSKIPMPRTQWSKENMGYAMCFFPFVGAIVGGLTFALGCAVTFLELTSVSSMILSAVVLLLMPILVTGGIHLDGLLDTADALSSYRDLDKRLEILKDSNSGAFAIITCVVYFLIYFAVYMVIVESLYSQLMVEVLVILALSFVLSRAFSGLSVVTFPMAKNTGLAYTFSTGAQKKTVKITMIIIISAVAVSMIFVHLILGLVAFLVGLLTFFYYKSMSKKEFGGITGDLCGWFLQISELSMAAGIALTFLIIN